MDSHLSKQLLLPKETTITGTHASYVVGDVLTMSNRTLTVYCTDSKGNKLRLKYFNGSQSADVKLLHRLSEARIPGVIPILDFGNHNGRPFYVMPQFSNAKSLNQIVVPTNIIAKKIIPMLVQIIKSVKPLGILFRDICPEHILYDSSSKEFYFTGLSNMAELAEKTTLTKKPGFGQDISYLPFEIEKYGYGSYSEFYSLGITLLALVNGKNPFLNKNYNDIYKALKTNTIPKIDIKYLQKMDYVYFSEEDKIHYLIVGLLIPNPTQRWGVKELACWLNNEHIPLIKKSKNTNYQYSKPLTLNGEKYWDAKSIAHTFESTPSLWSSGSANLLDKFFIEADISIYTAVSQQKRKSLLNSSEASIFYYLCLLDPSMNGFCWCGHIYSNISELAHKAMKSNVFKNIFSDILKNRCLSFMFENRKVNITESKSLAMELSKYEEWENEIQYKGTYRAISKYAPKEDIRIYEILGRSITSLKDIVLKFNPMELKSNSTAILTDVSFQSYLWYLGYESVIDTINITQDHNESDDYFMLLNIIDSIKYGDGSHRTAAQEYYRFAGEFAPIFYLSRNIDKYTPVNSSYKPLADIFIKFKKDSVFFDSVEKLKEEASYKLYDYNEFISKVVLSSDSHSEFSEKYLALDKDYLFNETWDNGIKTSPSFLQYVN